MVSKRVPQAPLPTHPSHKRPRIEIETLGVPEDDVVEEVPPPEAGAKRKKTAHRGRRSNQAQNCRLAKYVASGGPQRSRKVIEALTDIHHPSHYPSEFLSAPKNARLVRQTIEREYPDARHPENFPAIPSNPHGILVMPTPDWKKAKDPEHPPYIMLRLDSIVSEGKRSQLLATWDDVKAVAPCHHIKREAARSQTPAYHWGVWETTANKPCITSESKRQTPAVITAIDKLLNLVKKLVVPKIIQLTKEYLPRQWEGQERAYKRVQAWLGEELQQRPALDFQGAFFVVAVKEGCSERVHLDFNDGRKTMTWIWAVGDWEGAEFVAPQLGIRVPVQPGQVFGIMASTVAHFSTPLKSGRRVVFTCFTEQLLWAHSSLPPVIIANQ